MTTEILNELTQLVNAYKAAYSLDQGIPGKSPRADEQAYQMGRINELVRKHDIPVAVVRDLIKG